MSQTLDCNLVVINYLGLDVVVIYPIYYSNQLYKVNCMYLCLDRVVPVSRICIYAS